MTITLPSTGVSQATAIEQSRAIAEVQAAVVVARQFPREVQLARRQMLDSCAMQAVAERAFYSYPRAGATVSGESIHLARELARCWGNLQYSIVELSRNTVLGQSEILAYAWDLESNTRSAHTFIVPHKRDKKTGIETLTDLRDVYENNANNGARRVRECIFAVLPPFFVQEAKTVCYRTLEKGGGEPLPQRIGNMIAAFERQFGVSEDDIARKLGRASSRWSPADLARLGVVFRSLERGEITRDEEFPPARVTAAEILAQPTTPPPASTPVDDAEAWLDTQQPPDGQP